MLTKAQLQQIIFRPPYHREDYFSVLKQVDVNLETFPFGGGNTVLQSIASGTPIITLTGDQIKGRFGTGFYAQLGTTEFCATTIDEYVTKAIDVAHNPKIKADFSSFVKENKGRLFDNFLGHMKPMNGYCKCITTGWGQLPPITNARFVNGEVVHAPQDCFQSCLICCIKYRSVVPKRETV